MLASLSFLASDHKQLPVPERYGNSAVEAVSFNRSDLEDGQWLRIWQNIEAATKLYGPSNVTYHFPMNDSDYVEDDLVFTKLKEAISRAKDLGLNGIVVHSNRIKSYHEWQSLNIDIERQKLLDKLDQATARQTSSSTWVGLENMPLVGNSGYDIDPLFCFNSDFVNLPSGVFITWDICHHLSTKAYVEADAAKALEESLVIRSEPVEIYSFSTILARIKHWHFAAFKGLNDPARAKTCTEGILPTEGDLEPNIYASLLLYINKHAANNSYVNFEVLESSYTDRQKGPQVITWAEQTLID